MGDTLSELHAFATEIGCKPSWFHRRARHPHYDLTEEWRQKAIEKGAIPLPIKDIIKLRRAAEPSACISTLPSEDISGLPPNP